MNLAVEMTGITKRFGSVVALDAVDLSVEQGTIHALVGENGAGKTTLMAILYGIHSPDAGLYEVHGEPRHFKTTQEAIRAGIGMVTQHYAIIPELTCLENLILGAEEGPLLNQTALVERANRLASQMGFQFDWHRPASELSPSSAQKLEILKLLWRNSKVMILDEPTAMLSPSDSDALFASLRQLTAAGATVIFVTHRISEVISHCDRVSVLRNGALVVESAVFGLTPEQLSEMIIGRELPQTTSERAAHLGPPVAQLTNVSLTGSKGQTVLKEANLDIHSGEVVGIAGVDGNGQRELFRSLIGTEHPTAGSLDVLGLPASSEPWQRIERGLRVIPEDRHEEGVIEDWTLEENGALGLQRSNSLRKGSLIDFEARKRWAARVADHFQTRHAGIGAPMQTLSGGNQQRFVAARAILSEPRLLLAFQPARGLDVGSTRDVYQAIRKACGEGVGAIVVSFDLDELLEHCDRIVVLSHGRLIEPSPQEQFDRGAIGRYMVGA